MPLHFIVSSKYNNRFYLQFSMHSPVDDAYASLSAVESTNDLSTLPELSENTLLKQMLARFQHNVIYVSQRHHLSNAAHTTYI